MKSKLGWVGLAVCLALLGCAVSSSDDNPSQGPDIGKASVSSEKLKLIAKGPDYPVEMGSYFGLSAWLENVADHEVIVISRSFERRGPRYGVYLQSLDGKELRALVGSCDYLVRLRVHDFTHLQPRERIAAFDRADIISWKLEREYKSLEHFHRYGFRGVLHTSCFQGLEPGRYTLTIGYGGIKDSQQDDEPAAIVLLNQAFQGTLVSEPIPITFIEPEREPVAPPRLIAD